MSIDYVPSQTLMAIKGLSEAKVAKIIECGKARVHETADCIL